MKTTILTFLLILAITHSIESQQASSSTITDVTVFLSGAQITRDAVVSLNQGDTIIHLQGITEYISPNSIHVQCENSDVLILGVQHAINYGDGTQMNIKQDSLQFLMQALVDSQNILNAQLQVEARKQALIDANKTLMAGTDGLKPHILAQAVSLFDSSYRKTLLLELSIKRDLQRHEIAIQRLNAQIRQLQGSRQERSMDILIHLSVATSNTSTLTTSYHTSNASWIPYYNFRVSDISEPALLEHYAKVQQSTGVDWKDVNLTLSSGDPTRTAVVPRLSQWQLTYAHLTNVKHPWKNLTGGAHTGRVTDADGEALIGANVSVKGTTIGSVTDLNGMFDLVLPSGAKTLSISYTGYQPKEIPVSSAFMDVRLDEGAELSEVLVQHRALAGKANAVYIQRESAPMPVTVIANHTQVEMRIDLPYTIASGTGSTMVHVRNLELSADYSHVAVPKRMEKTFLIASIGQWSRLNLLEGEANIYFANTYIGRTVLDAAPLNDSISISMGIDDNVMVTRSKIEAYTVKRLVGTNIVEDRAFEIKVRNNKSHTVTMEITDQIPVPIVNNISVYPHEISGGALDDQTGLITWILALSPGTEKTLYLSYRVKHPRSQSIYLE